jgi:hypothetical protein
LCKDECARECDETLENEIYSKPLGRLEVFNSLKVLAPQIESIDRDRMMDGNLTTSGNYNLKIS